MANFEPKPKPNAEPDLTIVNAKVINALKPFREWLKQTTPPDQVNLVDIVLVSLNVKGKATYSRGEARPENLLSDVSLGSYLKVGVEEYESDEGFHTSGKESKEIRVFFKTGVMYTAYGKIERPHFEMAGLFHGSAVVASAYCTIHLSKRTLPIPH
jgi:hypothetical protein